MENIPKEDVQTAVNAEPPHRLNIKTLELITSPSITNVSTATHPHSDLAQPDSCIDSPSMTDPTFINFIKMKSPLSTPSPLVDDETGSSAPVTKSWLMLHQIENQNVANSAPTQDSFLYRTIDRSIKYAHDGSKGKINQNTSLKSDESIQPSMTSDPVPEPMESANLSKKSLSLSTPTLLRIKGGLMIDTHMVQKQQGSIESVNSRLSAAKRTASFQGRHASIVSAQRKLSSLERQGSLKSIQKPPLTTDQHNNNESSTQEPVLDETVDKPTLFIYPKKSFIPPSSSIKSVSDHAEDELDANQARHSVSRSISTKKKRSSLVQHDDFLSTGRKSVLDNKEIINQERQKRVSIVSQKLDKAQSDEQSLAEKKPTRLSVATRSTQPSSHTQSLSQSLAPSDAVQSEFTEKSTEPITSESVSPMEPSVLGPESFQNNQQYYEYLMLSQRHMSSNFIHQVDSSEVVWKTEGPKSKFIGPFLLGDVIGKGSFGKVKEGLCSQTLQRVAVKIISKKRIRKIPNGIESVIREIKMLRKLKHKNIITLIDVYCKVEDDEGNTGVFNWFSSIEDEPIVWKYEDGEEAECTVQVLKWYLVFEYCPCSIQTLIEQADHGKLPLSQAHKFFVQMTEGLNYLHSQNRDIKPGNMLVTPDGIVKISDFGVAEIFDMYTESPMECVDFAGTHQFISPEMASGQAACLGTQVDVWALGVSLYYMLTGVLPFALDDDGNVLALYENIVRGVYSVPPFLDDACKDLLQGLLQVDPTLRFTTSKILQHPWCRTFYPESHRKKTLILSYPGLYNNTDDADKSTSPSSPVHEETPASPLSPTGHIPSSHHTESHSNVIPLQSPTNISRPSATSVSENQGLKKYASQTTPCETTLLPYLEKLYGKEIQEEMEKYGKLKDLAAQATDVMVGLSCSCSAVSPQEQGKTRKSIRRWIKEVFNSARDG